MGCSPLCRLPRRHKNISYISNIRLTPWSRQSSCKRECVLLLPSYTFCTQQAETQRVQECKMISKYLTLPCTHLTRPTPLSRSQFCRMRWILRHRDVEDSVGATDFPAPLCRDIFLPCLCRVVACRLCRMCVGGFGSILHCVKC